ncbi:MAG: hypothetical protein WC975_14885 [Phycisphaerae bacterium]
MLELARKENRSRASGFLPESFIFISFTIFALILKLCGLALLVVSLLRIVRKTEEYSIISPEGDLFLGLILIALGTIIFSMVRLIRMTAESERIRESFNTLLSQNIKSISGPTELVSQDTERLQLQLDQANKLLQEINENTLLDETSRRQKYEFLAHQERKRIFNDIDRLVQDREWAQAKVLLEGMLTKYPANPEVLGYINRIEDLRKRAFNEELIQTRKIITDLVAISAWDKSIRQAESLMEKHPDMPAAKELMLHVRAERNKFREDQIKRMYADIQRSIGKKRWNDALQIGRQLTDKYPDSVEAEALREQLKTLETNAEIERRQELEEQIKDLVRRRNFIQALELARYVIEHYPTSPQATALRGQIDKLEELSKQQEKEITL